MDRETAEFDTATMIETVQTLVARWGLSIVGAIALLVIGMVVARVVRSSVRKALTRSGADPTLVPFLSGIAYYLVVAVVLTAVLGLCGIPATSFVAILGAAGFAVGLAMQGTLSNFSAGVMLLVFRPFRVGDFIEAAGVSGSVREIGIFSTKIDTSDNVEITVPNSSVYGQIIKNFAANDTRRIDLVIGVSYDDDLEVAKGTLERVLAEDERVLGDPAPVIAVHELADSSVNFVVRPWCKRQDYWPLRWDLTQRIKTQLEAAGCSIPYPQRQVHHVGSSSV